MTIEISEHDEERAPQTLAETKTAKRIFGARLVKMAKAFTRLTDLLREECPGLIDPNLIRAGVMLNSTCAFELAEVARRLDLCEISLHTLFAPNPLPDDSPLLTLIEEVERQRRALSGDQAPSQGNAEEQRAEARLAVLRDIVEERTADAKTSIVEAIQEAAADLRIESQSIFDAAAFQWTAKIDKPADSQEVEPIKPKESEEVPNTSVPEETEYLTLPGPTPAPTQKLQFTRYHGSEAKHVRDTLRTALYPEEKSGTKRRSIDRWNTRRAAGLSDAQLQEAIANEFQRWSATDLKEREFYVNAGAGFPRLWLDFEGPNLRKADLKDSQLVSLTREILEIPQPIEAKPLAKPKAKRPTKNQAKA